VLIYRSASQRGRTASLLATTSLAALLLAGPTAALAGNITENHQTVATVTNPAGQTVSAIAVTNSTVTGTVSNAGTITASQSAAQLSGVLISQSSVGGDVTNSGMITVTNQNTNGISVALGISNSTIAGNVTNSGTLLTSGVGPNTGINIASSTIGGNITNSGAIESSNSVGSIIGIDLTNATVNGTAGLTNSGTIIAVTGAGISVNGSVVLGGINNTGTIFGPTSVALTNQVNTAINQTAGALIGSIFDTEIGGVSTNVLNVTGGVLSLQPTSSVIGLRALNITNNGIILLQTSTSSAGNSFPLVNVGNLTLGVLLELEPQSGTIAAGQTISAPTVFTANGTLTNNVLVTKVFGFFSEQVTGKVNTTNANQVGVSITNNSGMALTPGVASGAGTFTTLTNPLGGVLPAVSVTNGASVNGGIINAGFIGVPGTPAKTGILVSGGQLSQPITNTGTIAGTVAAINVLFATTSTTINQNAGSIMGNILIQHGDVLNINGGTIQGDIMGAGVSTVNIAPTNNANDTFTYDNTISGVNMINIAAGANLALTAHGTIAGGGLLTLTPTSRITGNGTVTPNVTVLQFTNNTTPGNFPTINANKIQPGALLVSLVGSFPANGTQDFAKVFVASGSLVAPRLVQAAGIPGVQVTEPPGVQVTAQFVQSGNSADLILTEGSGGAFANLPGLTANEASVAAALDSILANSPNSPVAQVIGTALQQLTTTQDKINAVDFLTGEVYSSRILAALNGATLTQDLILERLDNEITSAASLGVVSNATGACATDLPSGKGPHLAPVAVRMYEPRMFNFWGEGIGDFGHVNGNGNASSISAATGGFVLGGDVSARSFLGGDWRFGLVGGYTYDHVNVSRLLSTSNVESIFGGAYAGASFGSVQIRAGALYGTNNSSNSRQVSFPGFFEALSSSNGGSIAQGFGEVGYRISLDGMSLGGATFSRASIEPFAGAAAFLIHENGFTEEGGAAALTALARDFNVQATTLGVHGRLAFASTPFSINTTLAWRHAYGDVVPSVLLSFAGTGQNFSISGVPIDRDSFVAEAGVDYAISPAMKVGLSYSGQFGQRAMDNSFKGHFDWRF